MSRLIRKLRLTACKQTLLCLLSALRSKGSQNPGFYSSTPKRIPPDNSTTVQSHLNSKVRLYQLNEGEGAGSNPIVLGPIS